MERGQVLMLALFIGLFIAIAVSGDSFVPFFEDLIDKIPS